MNGAVNFVVLNKPVAKSHYLNYEYFPQKLY
jgi:hypothetical protein